jgi:hypothetical protein
MNEELPPSERPPEPPRRRSWEEEKEREKEQEKEAEKAQDYAEKYRRDPISSIFWAGVLILAGLVFFAENFGYLPRIGGAEPWNWIAFGAGVLLLLEVLVRAASPDYARPVMGRVIFAAVLMMVGLSGLVRAEITWPLILVLVGVGILANTLFRRS